MSTDTNTPAKEHFYINREARNLFHLSDPEALALPTDRKKALKHAEALTESINRRILLLKGKEAKQLLPAQLHGMKLLHEVYHHLMKKSSGLSSAALAFVEQETSLWHTREYLNGFLEQFPPHEVYRTGKSSEEYLNATPNLVAAVEESYLVWLNNQNPALEQFQDLISDNELRKSRTYPHLISAMRRAMEAAGAVGADDDDLADLLSLPMRHAPGSLLDQLRYIRLHWSGLLEDSPWWGLLEDAILLIEDEDRYLFFEKLAESGAMSHGGMYENEAHVPSFASLGDAPARYSHDSSWMPEVVMIAKSTYVWLDQLSRQYGYPVRRLQEIPDRELDILAERGFTALWLIGLWERSHASQMIKRIHGNPEAKASAYALENYEIAGEIGGYDGYLDLRNRAMQRGIRLASDMVPNHTGIDSELVRQKPEWFLGTHEAPYPNYTYNGPNLSADSRYGIHIEDGYWNRTDAAVTFKRIDYLTGDTRYIYHGNDGTIMPWNDTAQLNFLDPEVREAVIQQILHVARMFPVIRFDAAMVLAKMHIQRLWFPLHGHAPGVPSRGAWSMSMADFEAAIPEEFWREVVDRVKQEVPDTLLLAEAFWMLEGYFVRTLGMHRVYNSAFMHMLKKEDNASYRQLIKKTLEFDAEILKRYVNFMNNPDEDTAIAQFGKGDKYFGVCIMMLTLPGLPMIGHGQVEGLTEKYGMEYARAYYDEQPDGELVGRHYREIFPIMKRRRLFAEVKHFHLFDLFAPDGTVNEHVFAYSNRLGEERALVLYNNRYESADGWIRISAGYLADGGIRQTLLSDALMLPGGHDDYVVFRDHASGLEFIRSCEAIRNDGLKVSIQGYRYNIFLDFRVVRPSRLKPYDRICHELDGRGVGSIELEALSMSLRPVHRLVTTGLAAPREATSANTVDDRVDATAFGLHCEQLLTDVAARFEEIMERPLALPAGIAHSASERYLGAVRLANCLGKLPGEKRLKAALGFDHQEGTTFRRTVSDLILLEGIQELLVHNDLLQRQLIDDWLLGTALASAWSGESGFPLSGQEQVDLFSCLLVPKRQADEADTPGSLLRADIATLFDSHDPHFISLMQFQYLHGKTWFREHRFTLMLSWLWLHAQLRQPAAAKGTKAPSGDTTINAWLDAIEQLDAAAFLSGYEMHALLSQPLPESNGSPTAQRT
ncbi:MAG: alpha-amylase [Chlorobiaceae bacterium]|nr:alpha-amylase [Chlorobiaceae bacterium]